MTNDELRKMQPLDVFLFWVRERWNILQRRKAGRPPPWTDDPFLSTMSFTNVRREDDRTTIWVKENIRDPMKDHEPEDIIFALVAARWFNYIPTMKLLEQHSLFQDWNYNLAMDLLKARKEAGEQIFTGAFVIATQSTRVKYAHVCDIYLNTAWKKRKEWAVFLRQHPQCSLLNFFTKLSELPGYGGLGFMCGQAIADLKFTKVLDKAPDWWTWCTMGPGSRRGLNLLYGKEPDATIKKEDFLSEVNRLRALVAKRVPNVPPLSASDLQSTLCEVSKYIRAIRGGVIKRKYHAK